ncbi:MAG: hypothetical protein K2J95_06830, partial [Lachnospiraceae bacterium]|nr:hypothetical protein [Lachnospiraceae bacterium]
NGTLKIIEQYVVGKEDGEWYIIAVSTEKVVKDNVTFTFPEEDDEPIDILDAWMVEFEQLNTETSFQLWHPTVRELAIEEILTEFSSLDDYAESMHEYYGDLSIEYEILESRSLSEKEQEDLIARLEEYYGVQLQFDFSDAWVYDVQESCSSDPAEWVVIETYYFGKEDGKWYILDVRVKEMVSIDEKNPDPVIWEDDFEGFDSGEEALDQFISEYLIDLKESYNAAHPMLRDTYLQLTLELFNASSVEEYNAKMASAFGDSTLTYEINEQYLATDEELERYLSYIYETYGAQLDLSECILYSITLEIHEPNDEIVDFTEEIVVGKDGDKWYVIEGLIG